MYDILMPKKVRLLALKTMLSARLAEGRIIIIDNCDIPDAKTRSIDKNLDKINRHESLLLISTDCNPDFKRAAENIERLKYVSFDDARISDMLKYDKLVFTVQGAIDIMNFIHERTVLRSKPKAIKVATPTIAIASQRRKPVRDIPVVDYIQAETSV
jgi:ribosomal protein L4